MIWKLNKRSRWIKYRRSRYEDVEDYLVTEGCRLQKRSYRIYDDDVYSDYSNGMKLKFSISKGIKKE